MTEAITGLDLAAARDLAARFTEMIRGAPPAESLGESRVLSGVARLPARVKCATLAWQTLEVALAEAAATRAGS